MQPLSALVEAIRSETGRGIQVPHFDPSDGGIAARCLFLLEAPGPKAVRSGFVSRNNPDETAKNFFELSHAAGIMREHTVLWNIVPWYIGSGAKIRSAARADIKAAHPYLTRLLAALPRLEVVVLVGRKAELAEAEVLRCMQFLKVVTMPHPSPLFVNRLPGNRARLLRALQEIAQLLVSAENERLSVDGEAFPHAEV
jgi:uracil-DNA glycosylase